MIDSCPFCKSKINPEATTCAACGAMEVRNDQRHAWLYVSFLGHFWFIMVIAVSLVEFKGLSVLALFFLLLELINTLVLIGLWKLPSRVWRRFEPR